MANKCDGCKYKGEHQEMGFVPFGVCLKETNLIKAEQTYKAEHCPWIIDAYANGTSEELQKTFNDLRGETQTEDFQQCVGAIQGSVQEAVQILTPIVEDIVKLIKEITDALLLCYPNKKVLRLALYHPKERVRKKNIHRIKRWVEKLHRNKNF